jgi:hypothetical protein
MPRLTALFAGLSVIAVFALIELRHSTYIERLNAFVEEQAASAARSDQPLDFPEFLGLGGDPLSIMVALAGSVFAMAAIYLGSRSWTMPGSRKLLLFLSRFGVFSSALSLFWIGAISFGFV